MQNELKPLTIEDLHQKCGMAVLVERTDGTPVMYGMDRVAAVIDTIPAFGSMNLAIQAIYGHNLTMGESDYGITWVAYGYEAFGKTEQLERVSDSYKFSELTAGRVERAIHELSIGEWIELINESESENPALDRIEDAVQTSIAALRAEQERRNPQPLTLEELREMIGEPVYLVDQRTENPYDKCNTSVTGWVVFSRSNSKWFFVRFGGGAFFCDTYGDTWLAYRTKPEGNDK